MASTATTIHCKSNVTKRLSHGLTFTVAYTWSRSLDVGSDQASFTINNDFRRNYGPSNYDRTHMLTISHIYELPFGKGQAVPEQRRRRLYPRQLAD